MKHNKRSSNYHSYLYEVNRKELVGKTKAQSPARYKRTRSYNPSNYDISIKHLLETGELVISAKVGKYQCIVAYQNVLDELKTVLKAQSKPNVTLQTVIRTLQRSIDKEEIKVNCQCADWRYRFAYWATKFDYKFGKPETRPAKITNPGDKLGSSCKHIIRLLKDKRWLVKVASILNDDIKHYLDDFRNAMDLSEDEMFINVSGRPSNVTNRNINMIDKSVVDDDSEDNSEGGDTDGTTDEE